MGLFVFSNDPAAVRVSIRVVKINAAALVVILALGGCARTPDPSEVDDDPRSDDERLEQTLEASGKGPSTWSPLVTVPLYPVLLAADTTIKFVDATYRYIRDMFGGGDEKPPVPERVEKQAEKIPKN